MKIKHFPLSFLIILILSATWQISFSQSQSSGMNIWFTHPADSWNEALPVGNGRLGAMIFGGIGKEHLELNESSVWTGEQRWDANPEALKSLPEVRKLLLLGKYREAEVLAQKKTDG